MKREEAMEILGVTNSSSLRDIRDKFLKKAKEVHPDTGGRPGEFEPVRRAYEVLANPTEPAEVAFVNVKMYAESIFGKKEIAKISETKYQSDIIKSVKRIGGEVINFVGNPMQRNGIPDLYVAHPLWNGFLELKVNDGRERPDQRRLVSRFLERGTPAFFLRWKDHRIEVSNPELGRLHEGPSVYGETLLRVLQEVTERSFVELGIQPISGQVLCSDDTNGQHK